MLCLCRAGRILACPALIFEQHRTYAQCMACHSEGVEGSLLVCHEAKACQRELPSWQWAVYPCCRAAGTV